MTRSKYLSTLASGVKTLYDAITASTGVSDAGKIIATNASGKVDQTFMPDGIQAPTVVAQTTEALVAGDFVNIHNVTGALRVRKANASAAIPANGFVVTAVASGANATVWLEGQNTALTGLTIGTTYFLGTTAGLATTAAPTATNQIIQEVGVAVSATTIAWNRQDHIVIS